MNWDTIEGNWEQFKGKVRETWGRLTDDDLDTIKGQQQKLTGKIQEKYGYTKDFAEDEVEKFAKKFKKDGSCASDSDMSSRADQCASDSTSNKYSATANGQPRGGQDGSQRSTTNPSRDEQDNNKRSNTNPGRDGQDASRRSINPATNPSREQDTNRRSSTQDRNR